MDTALDGLLARARAPQVYEYIIGELEANRYLRLMVQASVRALAVLSSRCFEPRGFERTGRGCWERCRAIALHACL